MKIFENEPYHNWAFKCACSKDVIIDGYHSDLICTNTKPYTQLLKLVQERLNNNGYVSGRYVKCGFLGTATVVPELIIGATLELEAAHVV